MKVAPSHTLWTEQYFKDPGDHNATAQLDVAIKGFKRAVALNQSRNPGYEWADHVQELVHGENNVPRKHLLGASSTNVDKMGEPEATEQEKAVSFTLEAMAAERHRLNEVRIKQRAEKLVRRGQFSAPLGVSKFRRGHHAAWGPTKQVSAVYGNRVIDTEGNMYQARNIRIR